jgi:hypothetical protein
MCLSFVFYGAAREAPAADTREKDETSPSELHNEAPLLAHK